MKILFFMLLLHIIYIFVLAPVQLDYLKNEQKNEETNSSKRFKQFMRYDWLVALIINALCWSIVVHLPLFPIASGLVLFISVGLNAFIYAWLDNLKENKRTVGLLFTQVINLGQLLITYISFAL